MANFKTPRVSFPHRWGIAPPDDLGPMIMGYTFRFNTLNTLTIDDDLEMEQFENQIGNIQSIFVDNPSANTYQIVNKPCGLILRIKATSQGWYPFFSADQCQFRGVASSTTSDLQVFFANVPMITSQYLTA